MKRSAALLVGALALAACSETTSPDTVDTGALADDLAAVGDLFENNAAYQSMLALSFYFPSYPATNLVRATLPRAPQAFRPFAAGGVTRLRPALRAPADAQGLPFPVDVQGKTFVWNATNQAYEPHPTRPGAPATGIRIILYTLDAFNAPTALEIGYLDLSDESTQGQQRLGVLLRLGNTTIADYDVTPIVATTSQTLQASGFITGSAGSGRVDFDLEVYENFQTGAGSFYYELSAQDGTQILLDVTDNGDDTGSGLVRVARGGNSIEVTFTETANGATGQVKFNGVVVATVTQSGEGAPVFTGANGHNLTEQQKQDLGEMFIVVFIVIFATLFGILAPAAVVF